MKTFLIFFSAPTLRVKYDFLICMNFWSFAWVGSVKWFCQLNIKTMKNREVFQLLLDSSFVVSVN